MLFKILANASLDFSLKLDGSNLVVLDGAHHIAEKLGIEGYTLIGDMDSISTDAINSINSAHIKLCFDFSQEESDLHKGISYCISHGASKIYIYNAIGGGRIDHSLSSFSMLKYFHKYNIDIILFSYEQKIFYVENSNITIYGGRSEIISIMPYAEATIQSKGLLWEMHNHTLRIGESESLSNVLANDCASINVYGNCFIIIPLSVSYKRSIIK